MLIHDHITKLVARVKKKDNLAFSELYAHTYQKIYFLALGILKDRHDAQDAVQEIYIQIWRNLDSLKDNQYFSAWAYKITYNYCIRQLSKPTAEPLDEQSMDMLIHPSDESDPLKSVLTKERDKLLMQIISELSADQRSVILLKYFKGFKIEEMAEIMDCPPGTIKSRLNSARNVLRDKIRRHGKTLFVFPIFLPIRHVLLKSASHIGIPTDDAKKILLNVYRQSDVNAGIYFIPKFLTAHTLTAKPLICAVSGLGTAGLASSVIMLSTPDLFNINISVPQEPTSSPVQVTADITNPQNLKEVYAVSADSEYRFYGEMQEDGSVRFTLPENGSYTLYSLSRINKSSTEMIHINCIDKVLPYVKDYLLAKDELTITIEDDDSGIDYASIYGLTDDGVKLMPLRTNPEEHQIVFAFTGQDFLLSLADKAGNTSKNRVKVYYPSDE